ncbi:MAG: hypothetical protein PVS2B2_18690 [Candidatus Acidiferrum sp.]
MKEFNGALWITANLEKVFFELDVFSLENALPNPRKCTYCFGIESIFHGST